MCIRDSERELVDNSIEPVKAKLRLAARALRLAKRLSTDTSWTLWNASKISEEVAVRLDMLINDPRYKDCCPCGRSKSHCVSFVRVDAAQFFKNASTTRGIRRTRAFLNRLEDTTGFSGVAVRKSLRASGNLSNGANITKRTHTFCSFDNIYCGIQYAAADTLFTVGDTVLDRVRGWPMGGSFSEPATLIDLNHDILKLQYSGSKQREVGWDLDGFSPNQLVAGWLYVDDALVGSKIYCSQCPFEGIQRLWPSDVGTTLEESGHDVTFLQARVRCIGKDLSLIHI